MKIGERLAGWREPRRPKRQPVSVTWNTGIVFVTNQNDWRVRQPYVKSTSAEAILSVPSVKVRYVTRHREFQRNSQPIKWKLKVIKVANIKVTCAENHSSHGKHQHKWRVKTHYITMCSYALGIWTSCSVMSDRFFFFFLKKSLFQSALTKHKSCYPIHCSDPATKARVPDSAPHN